MVRKAGLTGMPMEVSYKLNGMPLDTDGFHVTVK